MNSEKGLERVFCDRLASHIGQTVLIKGWVHRVRALGKVRFIVLRDKTGTVQVVASGPWAKEPDLPLETAIWVRGLCVAAPAVQGGVEVQVEEIKVLSLPVCPLPFEINYPEVSTNLDNILDYRVVSLRNPKLRAVFTVQSEILRLFREYLDSHGFTEVHTPKIVASGTEGGAELFPVKYFEQKAYLAQSPQFYKQMLVGAGFERVYEIAPAYRAEMHNTSRHINEFISLDLEMGFIDGLDDLLELEENLLRYIFDGLKRGSAGCLDLFGVKLPEFESIPRLTVPEVAEILEKECGKRLDGGNLDAEDERLISEYIRKTEGSELLFVTHYPVHARPMYTMPDPVRPGLTKGFDLLFRGMEMNSGAQRIHVYQDLIDNMVRFNLNPEDFASYLEAFKYGMPPHGGFAIGLERLTMRVLGLSNIREATLFPRDRTRLIP